MGAAHDFDAIYREAGARLWRSLYAFTAGQREIAHEALAEAFARAMERDGQIRDPVPYLYRTAFRIAAAEMRRTRHVAPEPEHGRRRSGGSEPTSSPRCGTSRPGSALRSSSITKPISPSGRWPR